MLPTTKDRRRVGGAALVVENGAGEAVELAHGSETSPDEDGRGAHGGDTRGCSGTSRPASAAEAAIPEWAGRHESPAPLEWYQGAAGAKIVGLNGDGGSTRGGGGGGCGSG